MAWGLFTPGPRKRPWRSAFSSFWKAVRLARVAWMPAEAIGSGGNYALSAARALDAYEDDAEKIARRAMEVAAEVCVFTNDRVTVETI